MFRNDSAKVFQELSKGLAGSKYAATIARFYDVNGRMNGRGAYFAAETQHAGQAVWEEQIENSDDYTKTRKWSGLTSMLLESHIDGHRNAFVNLTEADTHVNYQLPNDRTRTTQFLNSLNSTDPELIAAIVDIKKDDPGMRENFEETIAFLAPCDLVACKRSNSKQPSAEISGATANIGNLKDGKFGTTGVELRWYKYNESNALDESKQENYEIGLLLSRKREQRKSPRKCLRQ